MGETTLSLGHEGDLHDRKPPLYSRLAGRLTIDEGLVTLENVRVVACWHNESSQQPDFRNREVNHDPRHIDERGDERAGSVAGIEAELLEHKWQQRTDERAP